jgi:hypothetical protein
MNAFMYDVQRTPERYEDGRIDLVSTVASDWGSPTRVHTSVKPGGNRVVAYLELVLTELGVDQANVALEELTKVYPTTTPPVLIEQRRFAAMFNCDIGLYPRGPQLLEELGALALKMLRGDPAVWTKERASLVVEVFNEDDGMAIALDEPSAARVRRVRDQAWRTPRIHVDHGVFQDLESVLPDVWAELAVILTGLTTERLLELGGVRFDLVSRLPENRRTLVEWPERSPH